jgi:hypothetical protein
MRSWEDIIKMGLYKLDVVVWTVVIWLRLGAGGGRL